MMSQRCAKKARVDREVAALVKGMLARGDALEDIAAWFGLNVRVVQAVQTSAIHSLVPPAPLEALPPQGPYDRAPVIYSALKAVDEAEETLSNIARSVRTAYARS